MNASEAGGELGLIQSSLHALEQLDLHNKHRDTFIKTRSPAASLPFKGQVSEQTTVKRPIRNCWIFNDLSPVHRHRAKAAPVRTMETVFLILS